MPDQTVDFGNGQSMVFRKYVPERIKPRAIREFKPGEPMKFLSFCMTKACHRDYIRVDAGDTVGYVTEGWFDPYDYPKSWWFSPEDIGADGLPKFVDGGDQRTYGSLAAGDVFEFQGVACHKRIENGVVGYTPLLNISRAGSFPQMEGDELVKYLGRFEFTR